MHLTSRGVGMGSRAQDFLAKFMIMLLSFIVCQYLNEL